MTHEVTPWTCDSCGYVNTGGQTCELCKADKPPQEQQEGKPVPGHRPLTADELQRMHDDGLA